jgi:uncharacterized protein (DUF1330 family)
MVQLNCVVYTEKYIDKIARPLKKFEGKVLLMEQSYTEKDFQDMKTTYNFKIHFKSNKNQKDFLDYIRKKVEKKYDFFLEVI